MSNTAIAMKTGELDAAIKLYKYSGKWGWGLIFARVVLGALPHHPHLARSDLIIPMPAFVTQDGGHSVGDHAARTIRHAIEQDDIGYPFRLEPPVIIKTTATETMASAGSLARRARIAATIYAALAVVDERAVRGRRVVVHDDVFTTGSTLDVVARRLREAGADEVYGLTLSRAQWR